MELRPRWERSGRGGFLCFAGFFFDETLFFFLGLLFPVGVDVQRGFFFGHWGSNSI